MQRSSGEARFFELAAHLPDYVNLVDRERRFRWANRLAPGLVWEQIAGTRVDDWVTPESRDDAIAAIERCFASGQQTSYRVTAYGDGIAIGHYENRVVPAPAPDGTPYVVILTRDVTAQVIAAESLRESQDRLARAMSSGRIGLWEYNPSTDVVHRNEQLAKMLGLPEHHRATGDWLDCVHPDDRERVAVWGQGIVRGEFDTTELEYRARAADGEYRWFIDRAARQSLDSGKTLMSGVVFDVTDLRRVEQERLELMRTLEQAQRLESVGLLAGGIAHDFNNILMIIQTAVDVAAIRHRQHLPLGDELEHIKAACTRAATLAAQLLAFGRRSELQVQTLDLRQVVADVSVLCRRLLPKNIEIQQRLPEHALPVQGDAHQLEQVLLNLCINARDAMPSGGELCLSGACVDTEVELLVTDTGTGMPTEVLEHIFEPFYTTKARGEGTGLGLAMVHGIVEQHRGSISVTSELGHGTQFRIRLPKP